MAPWWRRRTAGPKVCSRCGGTDEVRRGRCRDCREATTGEAAPRPPVPQEPVPESPTIEPAHNRPWVHRGSG